MAYFIKSEIAFRENKIPYVVEKLDEGTLKWLEASGEFLQGMIKNNTKRDTGKTAASWKSKVKKESPTRAVCYIYSDYDNAVFEEFGTGEYIEKGIEHTPKYHHAGEYSWPYMGEDGKFHIGVPKKPNRPARNAIKSSIPTIKRWGKDILK